MRGKGIVMYRGYEPEIRVERDQHGRILRGLVIGDVLRQNQALLLQLHPGELKENPVIGIGIGDMLLDHDPLLWRARIREQLQMDGQKVGNIRITTTGIQVAAQY